MIEYASGPEVVEFPEDIMGPKNILDTGNFRRVHKYKNHMIEFTSAAAVDEFLYGEDIMDKKLIILVHFIPSPKIPHLHSTDFA